MTIAEFIRTRANSGSIRIIDIVNHFDISTEALAEELRQGQRAGLWTTREEDYSSRLSEDEHRFCPVIGNQPKHWVDLD